MSHPAESRLALYAGNELGLWARLRTAAHVRSCDECSRHVEEYRALREWTLGQAEDLPEGVNWNLAAAEMKANIRLGLAAGECVAPDRERFATRWRTPALVLPVLLLIVAGWMLQTLPPPAAPRAAANLADDTVVFQAGGEGIGVQAEGHGFTLLNPRADGVVFSVRGPGAVRARYVDRDTGQVTISHVYAQ